MHSYFLQYTDFEGHQKDIYMYIYACVYIFKYTHNIYTHTHVYVSIDERQHDFPMIFF